MSQPYVGEIRMFAGNFAPEGWMFCEGQALPIAEYDTLFNLIGTTYGGDGQETFQLPDLRGRVPICQGTGSGLATRVIGERLGVEDVTLTTNQIPAHEHYVAAVGGAGNQSSPANDVPAGSSTVALYNSNEPNVELSPRAVTSAGGSQPHDNVQPSLCISYIIALYGIYPSPS